MVRYVKERYVGLAEKTSELNMGVFFQSWKFVDLIAPRQMKEDGEYVLTLPSPMSWKARHPGLGWDDGYGDGEGVSLPSDFNRHTASIRCQRLESIFLAEQSGIKLGAEDDSSVGE